MLRSLDIDEKQVLVPVWENENELYWHHRVLVCTSSAYKSSSNWSVDCATAQQQA